MKLHASEAEGDGNDADVAAASFSLCHNRRNVVTCLTVMDWLLKKVSK